MLTRFTKKISALAFISFLVAFGVLVASFLYVKAQGTILHEQVAAVLGQRAQEQAYFGLEQMVASSQAEREEVESYILSEQETIDFLSGIEADAVRVGVVLTTDSLNVSTPKAPAPKPKTKASSTTPILKGFTNTNILTVNFSIKGSQDAVETMVQMLETLPYLSYINRLSLTTATDTEGDTTTATVELMVSLKKI